MKLFSLLTLALLLTSFSALAGVLKPYPARGSVEEAQDLEILLQYQENRTAEQCKIAKAEESASLNKFFKKPGLLSTRQALWMNIRLFFPLIKVGIKVSAAKKQFNRPRPFKTWPELTPCIKRSTSLAYPSGHATLSRVYARLLSRIYPSKAAAFMKRADEVAENRVLGGVHHPSDIAAGKIFGDSIADSIIGTKQFVGMMKSAPR